MPDQIQNNDLKLPPPIGSPEQAEKYLQQILQLLEADKIKVSHTDLGKFDLASVQDHYRVDLEDYEVEVSHSKQPDSGKDFYILLFNNIKKIKSNEGSCNEKVILAYIHLTAIQFQSFKTSADEWLERKKIEEEAKRFREAMNPVNKIFEELAGAKTEELKEPEVLNDNQSESSHFPVSSQQETENPQQDHLSPEKDTPAPNYPFGTYPPYPQTSNF